MISRLTTLEELMHSFYPALFVASARMLDAMGISKKIHFTDDTTLSLEQRNVAIRLLDGVEKDCADAGFDAAETSAHRLAELLKTPAPTDAKIHALVEEFNGRLGDQMHKRVFFALTREEARYYEQWRTDWEEIIARFPLATDDVEEASKCLALDCYAASVYHSTQIIEIGILDLGIFIGDSSKKPSWSSVTKALRELLEKDPKTLSQALVPYRSSLQQIHATAAALQDAWRNKISHAEGRLALMTKQFSPAIAGDILVATKAFMRRLATELPPRQEPTA